MPIAVECPGCGRTARVRDELAGRTVSCKSCGEDMEIPGGRAVRRSGAQRGRPASGGSSTGLIIAGVAVGAVLLLAVGGFAVVKMVRNRVAGGNQFAPGGMQVDAGANPNATVPGANGAGAKSRFDAPDVANAKPGGRPGSPGITGPKNPQAGTGFGSLVAVLDRWRYGRTGGHDTEYETLKEPPDVLPPVGWDVDVDPPKELIDFSPSKKVVRVPIPKGTGLNRLGDEEDVVFPVVPSPFVSVGQNVNKKDTREIWDLTRPKKEGTITGLGVDTKQNALSPDGKFFAGTTGFGNTVIGVWDVDGKKPLVDIPLDDNSHWVKLLALPSSERLIVFTSFGGSKAHVFELPSGDKLQSMDFGWTHSDALPVFSPGGKYFAWVRRDGFREQTIGIYEVETGQVAGELTLPAYDISWFLAVEGLAFSPDGTELAALMDGWVASKIIVWNVADGAIVDHMTFPKKLRDTVLGDRGFAFRTVNPLVFFPGRQRLLAYEHGVIDRGTGLLVWNIPKSNIDFGRKRWPLDPSHVTVMSMDGQSGSVIVYKLPDDKISEATAKAAAKASLRTETPVTWVDQGSPTLPDWKALTYVVPKEIAWNVQPDPSKAPKTEGVRNLNLSALAGSIRQLSVAGGDSPKAFVARSTADVSFTRIPSGNVAAGQLRSYRSFDKSDRFGNDSFGSLEGMKKQRSWVDVYDLNEGKRTVELRMRYDGDMASVSPDGSKFLVIQGQNSNRLDIYTAAGEHVAGWKPFDDEFGDDGRMLVSAAFAGDNHVIALSGGGKVAAFELAGVKAVWAAENASQPSISPNGKYVGYSDGQAYYFAETSSGSLSGRIPDVGAVSAAAWRPDGKRLALLSEHKNGYYLFTADLTNGQVTAPFPVPVLSAHLRWFGDRYVLLDNRKLVDVEQKVVAWSYDLSEGDFIPGGPDGRQWFVLPGNGKPYLGNVPVPGPAAEGQLAGASLSPEFVLQPGGSCTINLSISHPACSQQFQSDLLSTFTKTLEGNRIKVAAGQAVTLTVTVNEVVGETINAKFHRFGARLGESGDVDVNYPAKTATCKVTFLVDGQPAWEEARVVGNRTFFITNKQNESIEQAIQSQYETGIRLALQSIRLPPFVFTVKSANGIGTTQLSPK